jgi:hypothetical protein
MENLHLKNLNNTNPIEYYFKELEIYQNKFEKLTTEVIELYFEQNNPKYNSKDLKYIGNKLNKKETKRKQLKTKYKTIATTLLNHFLIQLEELNKLNQKLDNNNNIVKSYINDIKNNKEKDLNIENLKNIQNSIDSIKTILNNGELVIDILKYKI